MAKKKSETRAPDPVTEAAARAAADLTELGARFALVGGLAVSAWGEPRYTRDVDLAVGVDRDDEAERLVHALSTRGYEVVTIIEQGRVGHLLALKVLSESERRLQDRIDIQELAKVATDEDWHTAEAMVRLIKERGFHRGRALVTRLRRWRRRAQPLTVGTRWPLLSIRCCVGVIQPQGTGSERR